MIINPREVEIRFLGRVARLSDIKEKFEISKLAMEKIMNIIRH